MLGAGQGLGCAAVGGVDLNGCAAGDLVKRLFWVFIDVGDGALCSSGVVGACGAFEYFFRDARRNFGDAACCFLGRLTGSGNDWLGRGFCDGFQGAAAIKALRLVATV